MDQNRMKQQEDQVHSECQSPEGYQVFLRLQNYKKNSLKADHYRKLVLEDWLLSLMSTLVMGFGPQD